jgi:8-oxo-dGTP pyrophosphatase MutT (NUDIX family)
MQVHDASLTDPARLSGLTRARAVHEDTVAWDELRLARRLVLTEEPPPLELTTSARAVIFRGAMVVVVADAGGASHVMPGGRREDGESVDATARREVLEECGWRVGTLRPLGVLHFRHLTPRPEGYPYPYPDFLQALFVAEAESFERGAIRREGWEKSSRLTPVSRAKDLIGPDQRTLLAAALQVRRRHADVDQ